MESLETTSTVPVQTHIPTTALCKRSTNTHACNCNRKLLHLVRNNRSLSQLEIMGYHQPKGARLGFSPALSSIFPCSWLCRSSANGSSLTTTTTAPHNKYFQSCAQLRGLFGRCCCSPCPATGWFWNSHFTTISYECYGYTIISNYTSFHCKEMLPLLLFKGQSFLFISATRSCPQSVSPRGCFHTVTDGLSKYDWPLREWLDLKSCVRCWQKGQD